MCLAHADAKRRRRNVDTRQVDLPVLGSLRLTQDDNVTRLDAKRPRPAVLEAMRQITR
jgi:hypothetical protein